MITYLKKKNIIITRRQKGEEKEKNIENYIHTHIFNNLSV